MTQLARHGRRILTAGLVSAVSVAAAVSVVVVNGDTAEASQPARQNIRGGGAPVAELVKDQYIVTLKKQAVRADAIEATARGLVGTHGGQILHTYGKALHGFAVAMNETAAQRMAKNPNVESVQQVQKIKTSDVQLNPPSWGLDRIDQVYLPLDKSYTYPTTASNVTAYVIDSGIRYTHQDFGGRAVFGYDAFGGDGSDCNGHGTHVAGTIGGTATGVAKAVKLVSVRVVTCDGNGTTATVVAGLNWVATQVTPGAPAVANISLGTTANDMLDQAVKNTIAAGVTVVVAAGNENDFTCDYSPARIPEAITVGATDLKDTRARFSNWGACNDLFAPGVDITSDSYVSDTATEVLSGTSMATPHVTGAAALLLSQQPTMTPAQVHSALVLNTNKSRRILNIGGSNPPPNPPPAGSWHVDNLPATGTSSRVTMATNGGRVDAFVASNAPGRPILHATKAGGNTWTAWENLSGTTVGNPTAVWISSTRLELFVTGTDGAVWHRWWDGTTWHPWESLGGTVAADVVIVSAEPGALDVYAISSGDSAVWWRTFDGYQWFNWYSFGGTTLRHNFSAVVDPLTGGEVIFAQGTDGAVWYRYFDGGYVYNWVNLGGTIRWDIKAVATSEGKIDVFVPGVDKAVWHRRWDRTSWSPWLSLGGVVYGDGVEAVGWDAGIVHVFARSVDSRVYERRWDNTTWSQWAAVSPNTSSTIPTATGVLTYQLELGFPVGNGTVYAARWN